MAVPARQTHQVLTQWHSHRPTQVSDRAVIAADCMQYIGETLRRVGGNKTKAAMLLDIARCFRW